MIIMTDQPRMKLINLINIKLFCWKLQLSQVKRELETSRIWYLVKQCPNIFNRVQTRLLVPSQIREPRILTFIWSEKRLECIAEFVVHIQMVSKVKGIMWIVIYHYLVLVFNLKGWNLFFPIIRSFSFTSTGQRLNLKRNCTVMTWAGLFESWLSLTQG